MAKGKKYYWIKLKTSFMTSDKVDFLMSQKDGANYVVLYQMLCLKTINTQGSLSNRIGEVLIPYDVDKVQRDCKYFNKDTIIVALELYKKLGMIYANEENLLQIADFNELVGGETDYAGQKRKQRQLITQDVDKLVDNVHTEIELEKEIDIELDIEKDKELNKPKKKEPKIDFYEGMPDNLIEALEGYADMRKLNNKKTTEYAKKLYIKRLKEGSTINGVIDIPTAIKMVENATVGCWSSIYPLKENKQKKPADFLDFLEEE